MKPVAEGRTPCVGRPVGCGRTWRDEGVELICNKCLKKTPRELQDAYKAAWKRYTRLHRVWQRATLKHGEGSHDAVVAARAAVMADIKVGQTFDAMKNWLREPDRPEGLDQFLKDAGLQ